MVNSPPSNLPLILFLTKTMFGCMFMSRLAYIGNIYTYTNLYLWYVKEFIILKIYIYIYNLFCREQIYISHEKPYIYLQGEGMQNTKVISGSGESITASATFKSLAGNIVVSDITFVVSFSFKNSMNLVLNFSHSFLSFFCLKNSLLYKEHLHLSIKKKWILCIYIKHLVNKN